MAKLKLPEQMKAWKVISPAADNNGYPSYQVVKNEFDGTKTNAIMTFISFEGEKYSSENVDLINEEAAFVKSVCKLRGVSNYIDAVVDNKPAKSRISMYLLTTTDRRMPEVFANKQLNDNEIVDFGLQISEILDKLESANILHGNIKPENIFITPEGQYVLGGFTAFEGDTKDLSFIAPELYEGGQPDYTTDLYSLGLIMYTMANDGKLPFETDGKDRAAAIEKRFSKAAVTAPVHGSEKLKSVIVIACQPENKNRWKNAGNIKNALASIKAELPGQAPQQPEQKIIIPESTAFESNVFEEDAFEEVEEAKTVELPAQPVQENNAPELTKSAAVSAIGANASVPSDSGEEIDNRVFDEYEPQNKVVDIKKAQQADVPVDELSDFFEQKPGEKSGAEQKPKTAAPVAAAPEDNFDDNSFTHRAEPAADREPTSSRKGFVLGIIIGVAAILLALTGLGFFAVQNGWISFGKGESSAPADTKPSTDNTTATAATTPSTTAPQTTVPSTTDDGKTEVVPENVVGYFYDYAIEVLEAQGFVVDYHYDEREYSDDWDIGFVISMSPDDGEPLKKGSTIKIIVSAGRTSSGNDESSRGSDSDSSRSDSESSRSDDGDSSGESSRQRSSSESSSEEN